MAKGALQIHSSLPCHGSLGVLAEIGDLRQIAISSSTRSSVCAVRVAWLIETPVLEMRRIVFTVEERADCLLKYRAPATNGGLLPLLRLLLLTSGIHAALSKAQSRFVGTLRFSCTRWTGPRGGPEEDGEWYQKHQGTCA